MSLILAIIIFMSIALLVTGGMIASLKFLIWVGLVLLIISIIAFLLRSIRGRK